MKYLQLIINREEIYNWVITQPNRYYKLVDFNHTWSCCCTLTTEQHKHWHIIVEPLTSKQAAQKQICRLFPPIKDTTVKKKSLKAKFNFKTSPIKCPTHFINVLHYIGCSQGTEGRHIRVERNVPEIIKHERNKEQCHKVMDYLATQYKIEKHKWYDWCRGCGGPDRKLIEMMKTKYPLHLTLLNYRKSIEKHVSFIDQDKINDLVNAIEHPEDIRQNLHFSEDEVPSPVQSLTYEDFSESEDNSD